MGSPHSVCRKLTSSMWIFVILRFELTKWLICGFLYIISIENKRISYQILVQLVRTSSLNRSNIRRMIANKYMYIGIFVTRIYIYICNIIAVTLNIKCTGMMLQYWDKSEVPWAFSQFGAEYTLHLYFLDGALILCISCINTTLIHGRLHF